VPTLDLTKDRKGAHFLSFNHNKIVRNPSAFCAPVIVVAYVAKQLISSEIVPDDVSRVAETGQERTGSSAAQGSGLLQGLTPKDTKLSVIKLQFYLKSNQGSDLLQGLTPKDTKLSVIKLQLFLKASRWQICFVKHNKVRSTQILFLNEAMIAHCSSLGTTRGRTDCFIFCRT